MENDRELFRRTKYASWTVRSSDDGDGSENDVYAYHRVCKCNNERTEPSPWSWFIGEQNGCFNCDVKVPEYIQALIRLYVGR